MQQSTAIGALLRGLDSSMRIYVRGEVTTYNFLLMVYWEG